MRPGTVALARRHGHAPRIIIASARSIAQVLSPEGIVRRCQFVARRTDRDEFIASLARFGYRRESLVEHRAEFAFVGHRRPLAAQGHEPIVSTSSVTRSSD